MAAEWTYLVSKEPPHAAVVVSDQALTQAAALRAGEFSVTLCSAGQAALADFAGSVSGRDIDKTSSDLVVLRQPEAIATPWVDGGVVALECRITQAVRLPGYRMLIGEVVATHDDAAELGSPLVKHGAMYALGEPLRHRAIVAAAEFRPGTPPRIKVAAAGHSPDDSALWQVLLTNGPGRGVLLGTAAPTEYDDLLASFQVPASAADWNLSAAEVLVRRDGLADGRARISFRASQDPRAAAEPAAPAWRGGPDHHSDSGRVPCGTVRGLRPAPRGLRTEKAPVL